MRLQNVNAKETVKRLANFHDESISNDSEKIRVL